MRSLIFANNYTRRPALDEAGQVFQMPALLAGQTWTISLRFTDRVEGTYAEYYPDILGLRASLGWADERPATGTWKLQAGGGAPTGDNTTAAMDWNVPAAALKDKLNGLAGIEPHDFQVEWDAGSYVIWRDGGGEIELTPRANLLRPVSMVRVRPYQQDGTWYHDVRLVRAPLAFTDTAEQVLPERPRVETVIDGSTVSGYSVNEVQKLIVPAEFRGQYYFRRGTRRSDLLSEADDEEGIADALNAMLEPEGGTVTVTNPGDGTARIVFGGELAGIDVDPLEVVVPEEGAPPGDWTFSLDLNRNEVWNALRESGEIKVPFELEAEVYLDPDNHGAGTKPVKLWSEEVTVRVPQMWEGLAAAQNIDWLRPPSPKSYAPFSASQVLTGQQQAYQQVVGDGTATEFQIDHNLASELCQVVVRENMTGGRLLRPDEYGVAFDSANSLTVDFAAGATAYGAPEAAELAVFAVAIGPESVFQNHTHTIAQIEGLQDILDDYGTRIEDLEEILPGIGPAASEDSAVGMVTVIPEVSEVLFYRGEEEVFGEKGVDAGLLSERRRPPLLPAVHDAVPTDPLPSPLPAPAAGTVWVADGKTLIPGGRGMRGAYVEDDGYVAGDGRFLYAASRYGETNSYYPAAFERTLWAMAINDKMLAVNRTLEVAWGVQAQLVHANCNAQWVMSVQLGALGAETEPATLGLNLENVAWASPVFSQAIVLSRLAQSHFFGIRIRRNASEILLDQQLYGVWGGNNAAAPAGANFAIRARLDRFDTENIADPSGYLAWRLVGSMEIDEEGKQSTKPAQAKIF